MPRKFDDEQNKLVGYLLKHQITQSEFARMIGTHQTTISRLCRGALVPTLWLAFAIEERTGGDVPASYWLAYTQRPVALVA